MKSIEQIKNSLKEQKAILFERYPIKSLAIFGSYSRGDQNDGSDIDISVVHPDAIGVQNPYDQLQYEDLPETP